MRFFRVLTAVGAGVLLALGLKANADLPDLRGKTFFLTGKLFVSGSALGNDIGAVFPDGIDLTPEYAAGILINNTGDTDNSNLTGSFPIPTIPSSVDGYPVVTNPAIPLTGSFNRTTGVLTVRGQRNGNTVLDFGVHDIDSSAAENIKRILLQVRNLRITATATGTLDPDGAFRLRQPGVTALEFDISSNIFTGTPRVGLQEPNLTSFPFLSALVENPSFRLSNWTAAEPTWSGVIRLEGNASAAYPLTFAFTAANTADNFTRTLTPNANGTFFIPNIPATVHTVSIKGSKFLRQTVSIPFYDGDANPAEYPALFLRAGDANNDNFVDIADLLLLINSYNKTMPSLGYREAADFNTDGNNDITDLLLLIGNYNKMGQ